jgi:streptomycin 6-kinase
VRLPDGVLGMAGRGPDWATWVDRLPELVQGLYDDWELRRDGWMMHGYVAVVVPVITSSGTRAMLKVSYPDRESEHEHLALSHWGGRGAVSLLRADPHRRAMLLEALRDVSLRESWDVEACTVVAELYGKLHIPAFNQLRPLTAQVARQADDLAGLPRSAPLPRRLVEQAVSLARDLVADPASTGTLIHTDLHYDNVLMSEAGEWLAIDPKPLSGDPHYEVAPMLWNRFEELSAPGSQHSVRAGVRRRFHTVIDTAGLDEDRARDWVVVRMMCNTLEALSGRDADYPQDWVTTCVTVAKAVQD